MNKAQIIFPGRAERENGRSGAIGVDEDVFFEQGIKEAGVLRSRERGDEVIADALPHPRGKPRQRRPRPRGQGGVIAAVGVHDGLRRGCGEDAECGEHSAEHRPRHQGGVICQDAGDTGDKRRWCAPVTGALQEKLRGVVDRKGQERQEKMIGRGGCCGGAHQGAGDADSQGCGRRPRRPRRPRPRGCSRRGKERIVPHKRHRVGAGRRTSYGSDGSREGRVEVGHGIVGIQGAGLADHVPVMGRGQGGQVPLVDQALEVAGQGMGFVPIHCPPVAKVHVEYFAAVVGVQVPLRRTADCRELVPEGAVGGTLVGQVLERGVFHVSRTPPGPVRRIFR